MPQIQITPCLNCIEAKIIGDYTKAEIVDTPSTHSIEELCEFLNIPSTLIVKTLVYIVDKKPVLALIRGDKQIEETKLLNAVGGVDIRIAVAGEIEELLNVEKRLHWTKRRLNYCCRRNC